MLFFNILLFNILYPSSNDVNNLIDLKPIGFIEFTLFFRICYVCIVWPIPKWLYLHLSIKENITNIPIHFREQFHVYKTFRFQDMTKKLILDV